MISRVRLPPTRNAIKSKNKYYRRCGIRRKMVGPFDASSAMSYNDSRDFCRQSITKNMLCITLYQHIYINNYGKMNICMFQKTNN